MTFPVQPHLSFGSTKSLLFRHPGNLASVDTDLPAVNMWAAV